MHHEGTRDGAPLRLTRRRLILGLGAAAGGAAIGAACSIGKDAPPPVEVVVPAADVPAVDGAPFSSGPGKFHLVRTGEGVLVMSSICTHQGCLVPWREAQDQFHCPCHDSLFDRHGVRIAGPAIRPLDLVAAEVAASGDVTVRPRQRTTRQVYNANQAVPYPGASRGDSNQG